MNSITKNEINQFKKTVQLPILKTTKTRYNYGVVLIYDRHEVEGSTHGGISLIKHYEAVFILIRNLFVMSCLI